MIDVTEDSANGNILIRTRNFGSSITRTYIADHTMFEVARRAAEIAETLINAERLNVEKGQ